MTDVMTTKKPEKQKEPELIAAELLDQLIV
jgi:hypothetical protein